MGWAKKAGENCTDGFPAPKAAMIAASSQIALAEIKPKGRPCSPWQKGDEWDGPFCLG
jgi:hypothetical protein